MFPQPAQGIIDAGNVTRQLAMKVQKMESEENHYGNRVFESRSECFADNSLQF